jgi:hypothetical protein
MKDATVTINYESFQSIKDKADRYDKLVLENENILDVQSKFLDTICDCIENANEQKTLKNKQYFIAKGIRAICENFQMNIEVEFPGLDEGKAPDK